MKQFHLYEIDKKYLYVLQTNNNKKGIDILAIRGDIPHIIFPMYSSAFKKYKDLGIPDVKTLKEIDPYFLTCIQVFQMVCGDLFNSFPHNIREYIKDRTLHMNVSNRESADIDLLAMSINRSQILTMEELQNYVTDRIYNARTN